MSVLHVQSVSKSIPSMDITPPIDLKPDSSANSETPTAVSMRKTADSHGIVARVSLFSFASRFRRLLVQRTRMSNVRLCPSAVRNTVKVTERPSHWRKYAVYADKAVLVINKPAGMVSQPSNDANRRRSVSFGLSATRYAVAITTFHATEQK